MPKDRREEILEKSVQLFLKKGYDKATLRDIGKAVGIQAPGVYYYFKSKKDILNQIHQGSWKRFREMVLDPAKAGADPEEKIRLYVCNMIKFQLAMAEKNVMFDNSASVKRIRGRRAQEREVFDFLRNTLGELAAAKGLHNVSPTIGAFSLYAIVTHVHGWYKPNGRLTVDELGEELTRLFLFGFCKDINLS
jgi:TetR/AcrR family transcriptional regulator, cholesterol catabolism regulator